MERLRDQLEDIKVKVRSGKMLLVGIDVGKSKHSACFMGVGGEVYRRKFAFDNNREGFLRLEKQAEFFRRGHKFEGVVYGMEPSSVYWRPLYHWLGNNGGEVVLTNPLYVKRNRQTYDASPDKNDDKDAYSIGDMLKQGKFSLPLKRPHKMKLLRVRLDRYDQLLADMARVKARLRQVLGIVFPEVERYFQKVTAESLLFLLEKWPTPREIRELTLEELVSGFREGKIRLSGQRIYEIHILARETIGLARAGEIYAAEIKFYVRELRRLLGELTAVVTGVEEMCRGDSSMLLLLSIKGIGLLTASRIISEIGEIDQFEHCKQLVKLAGLDLYGSQSGSSIKSVKKITKKGSKRLRTALYQAALGVIRCNPEIKQKYEELLAHQPTKQKIKIKAVIAIASKLIRVVFGILKRRRFYDIGYDDYLRGQHSLPLAA